VSPVAGFIASFGATLTFLIVVTVTGLRAMRRVHIAFVALTVLALAVTVHYALELGKIYDLSTAGAITPIHLTLAKIDTVALLVPIVTGIRSLYVPSTIRLHKKVAWAVLALTVVCAITGTLMILMSERRVV